MLFLTFLRRPAWATVVSFAHFSLRSSPGRTVYGPRFARGPPDRDDRSVSGDVRTWVMAPGWPS